MLDYFKDRPEYDGHRNWDCWALCSYIDNQDNLLRRFTRDQLRLFDRIRGGLFGPLDETLTPRFLYEVYSLYHPALDAFARQYPDAPQPRLDMDDWMQLAGFQLEEYKSAREYWELGSKEK